MIDPDPKCDICEGSGCAGYVNGVYVREKLFGSFPCPCRMEINNCDRCTTLKCGETRAPSSRWQPPSVGVLCDACRKALYSPTVWSLEPGIEGTREGLTRLKEALERAIYKGEATVTLDKGGTPYILNIRLVGP